MPVASPDARAVFRSFLARNGREPSLIELLRELAVEPSGTPAEAEAPAEPAEPMNSAYDPELTAQACLRELLGLAPPPQQNPLLALLGLGGDSRTSFNVLQNSLVSGSGTFTRGPKL